MTALAPRLYADLIGKPFAVGARGPAAFDCVGLACEILRRRGIAVPAFVSDEAELHRQLADGGILAGANPLPRAEPGCIVLLRMVDDQPHIATIVSGHSFIHTTAQTRAAVIENLNQAEWRNRVLGFYLLEADA